MEDDAVLLRLRNLPGGASQASIADVLETLWKTRRTGLDSSEKSRIRSLFALPADHELDPILASLRLLMRKCVNEKLAGDDIKKLFPSDISNELQTILAQLLQKYCYQWNEESSRDESIWKKTRVSSQVKANGNPALPSSLASETLLSHWPRNDLTYSNNNIQSSNHINGDTNPPLVASKFLHGDTYSSGSMENLPRLMSMTWTMQNSSSALANQAATVTLKLQDHTNSSSEESEVKFQLSKDTLEAALRTLTYVSAQIPNAIIFPVVAFQLGKQSLVTFRVENDKFLFSVVHYATHNSVLVDLSSE